MVAYRAPILQAVMSVPGSPGTLADLGTAEGREIHQHIQVLMMKPSRDEF